METVIRSLIEGVGRKPEETELGESDCINLDEASRITGTDSQVILRAVKNGMALCSEPRSPEDALQFERDELELWMDSTQLHKLLETRMERGPDAAFLGDFPTPCTYCQKNNYILPFRGPCLVLDGGHMRTEDGRIRNAHYYCEPCYRWAHDFVVIDPADYPKTHQGMTLNEMHGLRRRKGQPEGLPDFKCSEPDDDPMHSFMSLLDPAGSEPYLSYLYEVDVIAPADGVFMTRKGKREDPAFEEEISRLAREGADDELGFLLDHGNSEISQIAHVLGRSLLVKPGEEVKQGQILCKAGGRHSAFPHLHWAVRDSVSDYLASGVPIRISECLTYGEQVRKSGMESAKGTGDEREFVPRKNIFLQRGMIVENNRPSRVPVIE